MGELRLSWIAGAIALWVLVIVVGSGQAPTTTNWLGTSGVDTVLMTTGIVIVIAATIFVLVIGRGGSGELPEREKRASAWMTLVLIGIVLLVWQPDISRVGLTDPAQEPAVDVDLPALIEDPAEIAEEPVAELADLLVIAIAATVAIVGFLAIRWYRATQQPDPQFSAASTDYADAVSAAHERLATVTDPRSAVIAAYAELEAALRQDGLDRGVSETPAEYLSRIVRGTDADPAPFRLLGQLYGRARYSTLEITNADQAEAADALHRAVGDRLAPQ